MSKITCQVLVVGLGPVGATLSALLADLGVEVLAIDKSSDVYPLPRAGHFDHEIMRVFQQLGIAEAILSHTRVATGYEFRNAKGEVLFGIGSDGTLASSGWAPSYMFNQPGMERVLRDKLVRTSSVRLQMNAEFKSLETSARGVQVTVSAQTGEFVVDTQYVVGCDGAWSPVREALGIKLVDLHFDEPWLVVDALPKPGCRLPTINLQICDPARPTTCLPLGPGRHRWEFMMRPGETSEQVLEDSFIQKLLAPWNADVEIDRKAVYRFHGLIAEQWRKGRVLIAGDAAHQTPPFAGQGMCAGIRDASNLAWKLASVLKGDAAADILDTYQVEREPNVRSYIELAIAMGRVVCTLDPEIARKRDEEMLRARAAGKQAIPLMAPPPLMGRAVLASTSASGEPFPQPIQGRGEETVRLDDILGPGPWLISRTMPKDLCGVRVTAVTIDDRRLELFRATLDEWLSGHNAEAVFVRPDRYVFGVGLPANLIEAWRRTLSSDNHTRAETMTPIIS